MVIGFLAVVYYLTLLPGVGWGDVAWYQTEALNLKIPLLAGAHPWHYFLAGLWEKLVPFGSVAWKQNLLSAVLAVGALMSFQNLCRRLEISALAVGLVTLVLGLSHTFWTMAVWAESYSLFAWLWILAVGYFFVFLKTEDSRSLGFSLFFLGLGMGNNLIQPFALPAILVTTLIFVSQSRGFGFWLKPFLWFLFGLSFLLLRLLWAHLFEEKTWQQIYFLAFDQKYDSYLFWHQSFGDILKGMTSFPVFLIYQFGLLTLFLFMGSKIHVKYRFFVWFLVLSIFVFCSTYLQQRAVWLLLAAWIPLAYLLAFSLSDYFTRTGRWLHRGLCLVPLVTIFGYWLTPRLIEGFEIQVPVTAVGQRDHLRTFFWPWKHHEHSANQFVDEVEKTLKPGDVMVADSTPLGPLRYAQLVENRLQDIKIYSPQNDLQNIFDEQSAFSRFFLARQKPVYWAHLDSGLWECVAQGSFFELRRAAHD